MTQAFFCSCAPHRRAVLAAFGTLAVAALAPQQGAARGGDRAGETGKRLRLSQRDFTRLSQKEVNRLFDRPTDAVHIEGFSVSMSARIVTMAGFRRRRTQGLMREMQSLEGARRVQRLRREQARVARELADLETAYERAKARRQGAVMDETALQIHRTRGYGTALDVWVRYPHEGAR